MVKMVADDPYSFGLFITENADDLENLLLTTPSIYAARNQSFVLAGRSSGVEWFGEFRPVSIDAAVMTGLGYQNPYRSSRGEKDFQMAGEDLDNSWYIDYTLEQIGTFKTGKYAGQQAVMLGVPGMGVYYEFFARDPVTNKGTLLVQFPFDAVDEESTFDPGLRVDRAYRFPDLDYPSQVHLSDGVILDRVPYPVFDDRKIFPKDHLVRNVSLHTAIGDLYYDFQYHVFFVESVTKHVVYYSPAIPFQYADALGNARFHLTWWYGSSTDEYRSSAQGGCGTRNYADVVYGVQREDLAQAGVAGNGDRIYEYADLKHPELEKMYSALYVPFSDSKISYEEFILSHPIFFWQDKLGRLIRFTADAFIPPAECAKPAIYLYPLQTQRVRVEVSPRGGFTYTEPPYNSGWEVMAAPGGTLTEITSDKTYPYLWWDGRGGLYAPPQNYWVVAQAEAGPFLRRTLPQLGLNESETAAFLEYWIPYFTPEHPYYKIGFHGTHVMNEIAPLNVTPQPDTIIRILMDYEGLSAPQPSNPPRIITPQRRGFTVVEWGGVKH
ncbi:MAG: hypothetical protein PHI63_01920 [Patescibacteria group bacterium]|nr:hypothetical protein [Patescibacteria group bacterium]